jgi:hypothetical protein
MRCWSFVRDLTSAEFIELQKAVMVRQGIEYLYKIFPVDSVVHPKSDHSNHEWHVVQYDLSEDLQTAWVLVFDPRKNITAKFNVEDLFQDGLIRDSYWRIAPTTSKN